MLNIDAQLLDQLGLGDLPTEEKDRLLNQMYDTLQMRVGAILAERMTDDQVKQFEQMAEDSDDDQAMKWLEGNFPDYKNVVEGEYNKLVDEVRKDADQIAEVLHDQA